jgi:hypothetical protein
MPAAAPHHTARRNAGKQIEFEKMLRTTERVRFRLSALGGVDIRFEGLPFPMPSNIVPTIIFSQ